jgi:hypothetical protein
MTKTQKPYYDNNVSNYILRYVLFDLFKKVSRFQKVFRIVLRFCVTDAVLLGVSDPSLH